METQTVIAVFIGIIAGAFLVQALAVLTLSRSMQKMAVQFDALSRDLTRNISALSTKADTLLTTLNNVAGKLAALQESLAASSAIIHKRVADLDGFLDEATKAARLQIVRMQDVVDTTSRRVGDTVATIQRGVMAPVTEVHAILAGVRVALRYILGRKQRPSNRSLQDEEMFI